MSASWISLEGAIHMRRFARLLLVAVVGASLSVPVLAAPASADPVVDSLACSAAGSYSRIVGGLPTTYWLVATEAADAGTRRYWHLERPRGVGSSYFWYYGSYVVVCRGPQILGSTTLNGWKSSPSLCGTGPFTVGGQRYTRVGHHDSYVDEIIVATLYRYVYWRVDESTPTGWRYRTSGYARCSLP
jgi:hypothetical protein